jgi:tetratricopeptide (TPR) repeat protein
MRHRLFAEVVIWALTGGPVLFAQPAPDELAQLRERVVRLEQQVQEMARLLEPLKAQQTQDSHRKFLREKFDKKMAQDRSKYRAEQLQEAEELYQVANQKWGSAEASESIQAMIKKYPDINRTGCATLYVAQKSEGDQRVKYLQDCIERFNDCFYGDGVQVGVYARFLLAQYYTSKGKKDEAASLYTEIKTKYPEAVDHTGNLLIESFKTEQQ